MCITFQHPVYIRACRCTCQSQTKSPDRTSYNLEAHLTIHLFVHIPKTNPPPQKKGDSQPTQSGFKSACHGRRFRSMIHAFTAAESLYITQPDDVEMPDQGRLHKGEKEGEKKQKPGDVRSEESSVRRSSGPDPVRAVGIVFFFL